MHDVAQGRRSQLCTDATHARAILTIELNNRDDRLAELTGYENDIEQAGPSPTGLGAHTEQRRRQLVAHLRADSSDHGWLIREHLRTLTFDPIGARARAVSLDTIDQLHQYALLYNLASNRLAHEGLMNPTTPHPRQCPATCCGLSTTLDANPPEPSRPLFGN